jgi:murein DD-endopeptidase MepM/ murein hydrolase activator NlpD
MKASFHNASDLAVALANAFRVAMLLAAPRQNANVKVRLLLTLALLLLSGAVVAHYAPPLPAARIAPAARQFGLPFAGAPGPNTWLLGQLYGNTTGAYRRRNSDYSAGQGIHFGMDFGAPCGTKVLAIGDGVVAEVDGPHGSAPHNLVINHDGNLSSLYGHLQYRSKLRVGQRIKRGDVIGLSGDSQFTCISAPHLHLEIRDRSHQRFLNPVPYIAADWDSLALIGAFGRGYQRDLSQPRRWQSLLDQPAAQRGGRLLNRYAQPWPPTLDSAPQYPKRITSSITTAERTSSLEGDDIRLTKPGCCVSPFWSADSQRVLFIDKPDSKPATIYAINTNKPDLPKRAFSSVAVFSPSQRIAVLPAATTILERLSDGRRVSVPTKAGTIFFSRSETQIAWSITAETGRFDTQATRIYTANLAGGFTLEKPQLIASLYGGGTAGWLNENELLLTGKTDPKQRDRSLRVFNVRKQTSRTLTSALNIRGLSINPNGTHIAYYVAFDSAARNGMYVQDVRTGTRQRLDWIGSYRWRDSNRLVYVPLEPAKTHRLLQWDVRSKQSESLVTLESRIAGDDWQVAPNGSRIVFVNAADRSLRVLTLP